ncbi:MAG: glycoside hydrolase family 127 protein, partial [Draconibacterium sp.]|nr:glycoside hydrolase family 127 protein [Draconibacterium sp.]
MNKSILIILLIFAFSCTKTEFKDYPIVPVPFNQVKLTDNFWKSRMITERDVTVPFSLQNGQEAIDRLKMCGDFLHGVSEEKPNPHRFISSDLYKVMEGAAYSLMNFPDEKLEVKLDSIIDFIEGAMEEDGYLYISHSCGNPNPREMGEKPYEWLIHSHELYNVGHMYEGAVAYYQATGKDKWLKLAEKNAQHVNRVFFEGGDQKYNNGEPIMQAPGHQEIELALCKLYRATGNELYIQMAKKFLDIRGIDHVPDGKGVMSPTYAQQQAPVSQQKVPTGHAVRAAYMYSAMADVDALTGKTDYQDALNAIWENLVNTRMHITGGLGAVHGIEGFGAEYELPNKDAYNETCAAVANVFFNYRMFLLNKDAKYLDIAELSLFNNSLAGINLAGNRFFYVNPLEADGIKAFNHGIADRAKWFGCACCPPNISRLILQTPGYMYAHTNDEIYLTIYAGSEAEIPLKKGNVKLSQISDYPFDGEVKVKVNVDEKQEFAFCLRIPTWAGNENFVPGKLYPFRNKVEDKVKLEVNGKPVELNIDKGFAVVRRTWEKGDEVHLSLPMPVRSVDSYPEIKNNFNRVAFTRGPLVYCAEEPDNIEEVQRLYIPDIKADFENSISTFEDGILKGIPKVKLAGKQVLSKTEVKEEDITLIPYYAWSNRGAGKTMLVWLSENEETSVNSFPELQYVYNIRNIKASFCEEVRHASVEAICDGAIPGSSADRGSIKRWSTIPQFGKPQWTTIEFKERSMVNSISVYWADRSKHRGRVKVPKEWNVEYRVGNEWYPFELYVTDEYRTAIDQFNVIHPAKELKCDAIKINVI